MKIRNGFVSNSSSSSFLVAFPSRPKSAKDVKDMVFGSKRKIKHPFMEDSSKSTQVLSEVIWRLIEKQIPNNRNLFLSRINNLFIEETYKDNGKYIIAKENSVSDWGNDVDWEAYEADVKKAVINFIEEHKGSYFYYFEFADDNGKPEGYGSILEHGDTFKSLPHLVSSNH